MREIRIQLSKRETRFAILLRGVKPLHDQQMQDWRVLRDEIKEHYVRPSRWERFDEITERGE